MRNRFSVRIVTILLTVTISFISVGYASDIPGASDEPQSLFSFRDKNDKVTALHEKLTELGFYFMFCDIEYSVFTEIAIRKLQNAMGWEENGKVMDETEYEKIMGLDKEYVKLMSAEQLEITSGLNDVSVNEGEPVVLKVEATGAKSYRWLWSTNKKDWLEFSNNSDTFTFTMENRFDGRYYQCFVGDGITEVESKIAQITLKKQLEITSGLNNVSVNEGEPVVLKVEATGAKNYRWLWSANKTDWLEFSNNSDTFTFTMENRFDGRYYQCFVSDGTTEVESEIAQVTLKE